MELSNLLTNWSKIKERFYIWNVNDLFPLRNFLFENSINTVGHTTYMVKSSKFLFLQKSMSKDHWLRKIISVQFSCSVVSNFANPYTAVCQASLSITNPLRLLKFISIESVMPFHHLILCHPLLLLPSIFPSIRVFSSESVLHIKWPSYRSFSFSISPSNEYSGLISFRVDWLDLLAVQRTFKIFSNTTVQKHQPFGTQLSL